MTNFAWSKIEWPKASLKGELQDVIRNGARRVRRRDAPHNPCINTDCRFHGNDVQKPRTGAFFMHGGESGPGSDPCSTKSPGANATAARRKKPFPGMANSAAAICRA